MANDRKQQIIKAAAKRFARHGLSKTTLDEVARDIRIGKATIYHYFTSKDDLYFSVLRWECDLLIEQVKNIFENESGTINQKLSDYIGLKDIISENNKLIYEALLAFFYDKALDQETEVIKLLIVKESELIKHFLTKHFAQKIKKASSSLPYFIVVNSWGMLFGNKLNSVIEPSKSAQTKELFIESLEAMLD
ncbi:MAG TPA: TetR/AcrR family transcriptional regulator [Ignavibacteriaceae bacterium]